MRLTLRILALVSLAMFGVSLIFDVSNYLNNPCPRFFLFKLSLVLFGGLEILPTLVGSAVAAGIAAARGQWGWLAGLLIALGSDLAFLYGAAVDHSPPVVLALGDALSRAFDQTLGLTTCGSQSSLFTQGAAVTLVLLAAPLALLSYSLLAPLAPAIQRQAWRQARRGR